MLTRIKPISYIFSCPFQRIAKEEFRKIPSRQLKEQLLFILFILLWQGAVHAQSVTTDPLPDRFRTGESRTGESRTGESRTGESRTGESRTFSQEKIAGYLEDGDFDYPERGKPVVSLWARFWRWFLSLLPDISIGAGWGPILRIALYVLCGMVIVYAILQLLGINTSQLLGRSPAPQVRYSGEIENIHGIDFEQKISEALAQQAYRPAIRWCYLWALKNLTDQQRIDWHPGKTNHDYLTELEDQFLQQRLSYLVYLYEYTWYGDFPADEALYRDARQRVDRLNESQPA